VDRLKGSELHHLTAAEAGIAWPVRDQDHLRLSGKAGTATTFLIPLAEQLYRDYTGDTED
jgi:hypothetical protein